MTPTRFPVAASLAIALAGCAIGAAPLGAPAVTIPATFEEFKAGLPREGHKYIVSGDIAISDEKELRKFFDELQRPHNIERGRLLRYASKGLWSASMRKNLTYCVSPAFGDRQAKVVADMRAAASAWEAVADVRFVHRPEQDARCTAQNDEVVFDVAPTASNAEFYAIAFFPYQPRRDRTIVVFDRTFRIPAGKFPQLEGVLRHELGHVLGFRHEFVHPDAGVCTKERRSDVEQITSFDPFSVMNYPKCNRQLDEKFELTAKDRSGAACQYGEAPQFTVDRKLVNPRLCRKTIKPPSNLPAPIVEKKTGQSVSAGGRHPYGPFVAVPGTTIRVELRAAAGGSGDADLYVRLGDEAEEDESKHDCRSALGGTEELCELDARTSPRNEIHVLVTGSSPARYDLVVTYVKGG